MNFSPSWSTFETSIGFELTATVVVVGAACLGLCWLDLGMSCWMVDWSADAVAVVSADAAILSRSRADSLTHRSGVDERKRIPVMIIGFRRCVSVCGEKFWLKFYMRCETLCCVIALMLSHEFTPPLLLPLLRWRSLDDDIQLSGFFFRV